MKVSNSKYYQLIPEKVLQDFPVISDLIRPDIKGFSEDYLKEVISSIASQVQRNEGPAPLSMAYLNRLVPQGQKYLNGLLNLDIVVRLGQFVPGEKCYNYEFAPEYFSRYKTIPLNNAKLIRRIESVWNSVKKEAAKSIRGLSEQSKYLDKLTIDDGYREFIEANYLSNPVQYNSILASAIRIINRDNKPKRDDTSGRFHSNVTNMAKGLRPFLRINNEPLVNIDVKNSQPYLSTIILTEPSKVSLMTKNPAFTMLLQKLKVSDTKEDTKKYISLVISGQLYEFLMKEFNLNRDETKRQVLRILFARNRMPKDEVNKKCRLIFKQNFPTVHRIFSKVRGSDRGDKFHSYKRFAILLQRIESYLMLDVILKRVYKELPGVIAITIHDSIMTGILTNNVEAVKKIMIDEFKKYIGFEPQIKIEDNKRVLRRIKREEREGIERGVKYKNHYAITNSVSVN